MPEYTLKDLEVKKDMPGYSGGPAKVLELTLEEEVDGGPDFPPETRTRKAEMFTMASTPLPNIGDKMVGTIEDSDFGPKWKKAGGRQGGGGFKRSPAETAAIQRQHSQHMALQREANIIASGGAPFTGEQLRSVINWFDKDIKGKDRAIEWDGLTSDIPVDTTDLDPRAA